VDWAVVTHPHTNGQDERANSLILQGLKLRILTQESEDVHAWLSARAGRWAAEVPSVLWGVWTMPNRLTNFTPFLMYNSEAVLPNELEYRSPRVQTYQADEAE
jgi:hypothetical protein